MGRSLELGQKLGRYELQARIARGGMAEVWLAEATDVDGSSKSIVLKTILPQYSDDPAFVTLFTNEATVAAALHHPNIVQISDWGVVDGTSFIAMEHVHGRTLRQIQRALGPGHSPPPWLALHVVMDVCDAIDCAHDHRGSNDKPQGIIHHDLTPENIMVSFAGVTKVLDFGIAEARPATLLTPAVTSKGKLPYMAPERIRAAQGLPADADRRSDIYSIGVVLYELLIGQLPFHDPDELGLLQRIVSEPAVPLRHFASGVPEELERITLRALAKEPSARHPTAAALRAELAAHLASAGSPIATERNVARFMGELFADESKVQVDAPFVEWAGDLSSEPSTRSAPAMKLAPAAPRRAQGETVLVVDPDGVSRRFVELALAKDGFAVECAKGATAAFEILQSAVIDLVICETDLPDMNGLQFRHRLLGESRLRSIPFVFLTSDGRTATKVTALRAGADEALAKPCDAAELCARVRALVDRQRHQREVLQRRSYMLAGDFSVMPIPDLVGMLEMSKRTGKLSIATPRALGDVVFDAGRIAHASFGSLTGAQAFYRMMEESRGQFEFSAGSASPGPETIRVSATELILEGARQIDMRKREVPEAAGASEPGASQSKPEKEPGLIAGTAITQALAAQFELGIRDGFGLGELSLWTGEELAAWTLSPGGRDRFHVHLCADLSEGAAAMLPLAAPPGEREILAGLSAEPKLLGLDFYLRNERLLDLVLVDIRDCSATDQHLLRAPALTLIAPPAGSLKALGVTARVGLEALLERTRPAAVLGLGSPPLEVELRELAYLARPGVRLGCAAGSLDGGRSDLRALLAQGIRLLGAQGA